MMATRPMVSRLGRFSASCLSEVRRRARVLRSRRYRLGRAGSDWLGVLSAILEELQEYGAVTTECYETIGLIGGVLGFHRLAQEPPGPAEHQPGSNHYRLLCSHPQRFQCATPFE